MYCNVKHKKIIHAWCSATHSQHSTKRKQRVQNTEFSRKKHSSRFLNLTTYQTNLCTKTSWLSCHKLQNDADCSLLLPDQRILWRELVCEEHSDTVDLVFSNMQVSYHYRLWRRRPSRKRHCSCRCRAQLSSMSLLHFRSCRPGMLSSRSGLCLWLSPGQKRVMTHTINPVYATIFCLCIHTATVEIELINVFHDRRIMSPTVSEDISSSSASNKVIEMAVACFVANDTTTTSCGEKNSTTNSACPVSIGSMTSPSGAPASMLSAVTSSSLELMVKSLSTLL